nr:MAG TPA_asm: hypothetical protein [Caudoviricetes sp.]
MLRHAILDRLFVQVESVQGGQQKKKRARTNGY